MATSNIYNSVAAAPQNMSSNGTPSVPTLNSIGFGRQQSGIASPGYGSGKVPLTYENPTAKAYQSLGGIDYGIATPEQYVENRLNNLISDDSRYMQLARQSGMNVANQRGMLNSSIAAGNSQAAAIQAAMPIAQADAAMLSNLQLTNLKDKTAAYSANRSAQAQESAAATAAAASQANTAASLQEAIQAQRERLAYEGEQAGLGRDWASQFAGQQEGYNLANMMQQYYNQSGLSNQEYQQQSGLLGQNFNNQMQAYLAQLGGNLLQGQQSAYTNFGLQAMNNPAIMGDPQAFGGYIQFLMNPFSSYIDDIFSSVFGSIGGTP